MMSIRKGLFAALMMAAPLLAGCGDDNDGDDDTNEPEQACLDTADAIASSAQRCGFDYKTNFDAFVDAVANGDCANILAVRDEALLYGSCIPVLKGLSCEEVNDPNLTLPDSCNSQLLRQE